MASLVNDVCDIIETGRKEAYTAAGKSAIITFWNVGRRKIVNTRVHNLSWSHIHCILSVSDPNARLWYLETADKDMWSFRALDRNISTQYYERRLADADVGLNPALREMEHRPHVKCSFRYTESTFHNPKTSILLYGILCGKVRIRHIAFQAIPLLVLGNLLVADNHFNIPADFKDILQNSISNT